MSTELPAESLFVGSPTDVHRATLALLYETVVEAARRRQDELPGLVETLQDEVVLTTGGASRSAYGWFAEHAWRYGNRPVHELFLNANRRPPHPSVSRAEDVMVTLLHETCHVWAQANGIKDTSRNGWYHNRRFAEIALAIGLVVEKASVVGHHTPSLQAWAQVDYGDLLGDLSRGLVLVREPQLTKAAGGEPDPDEKDAGAGDDLAPVVGPSVSSAKYVFASCQCRAGRGRRVTIRVARGSWRPGVIRCAACQEPFAESL